MPYSEAWPLIRAGNTGEVDRTCGHRIIYSIPCPRPRELGYRMPAEWEPHEATWLAWPHNPEDWPGKFQAIPWLYAEIVRLLSAHERVHILVEDAKAEQRVRAFWSAPERISTASASTVAHQPQLDARFRSDLRPQPGGQGRHHQLALQCLGQVLRLAS